MTSLHHHGYEAENALTSSGDASPVTRSAVRGEASLLLQQHFVIMVV
jgi:hypothetical protein